MDKIPISDFQKNLRRILTTVSHSGKPVGIMDRGKLLVKIAPPSVSQNNSEEACAESENDSWLGCMSDVGEIVGDIVSPAESMATWEVLSK